MFSDKKLKHCRKLAGMTQTVLARRVKCSRNTISQIELGHFRPKAPLAKRIAKALGVQLGELMMAEDDKPSLTDLSGEEERIIELYRQLPSVEARAKAVVYLDAQVRGGSVMDGLLSADFRELLEKFRQIDKNSPKP